MTTGVILIPELLLPIGALTRAVCVGFRGTLSKGGESPYTYPLNIPVKMMHSSIGISKVYLYVYLTIIPCNPHDFLHASINPEMSLSDYFKLSCSAST